MVAVAVMVEVGTCGTGRSEEQVALYPGRRPEWRWQPGEGAAGRAQPSKAVDATAKAGFPLQPGLLGTGDGTELGSGMHSREVGR